MTAYGGQEAIDLALCQVPDLIILDLMMPRVDGFQVIRRLAGEPQTRDIPIIICTAMDLIPILDQYATNHLFAC